MNKRNKILDAALRLYAREGFRGATTRLIAQEAGVNEVTLFRQFGSKLALIEASIVYHIERTQVDPLPEEPADPLVEITAWCKAYMGNMRDSRALMRKIMCELQQYPEMLARMKVSPAFRPNDLAEYVGRLQRQKRAKSDFNIQAAVQMLRGAIFSDAMGRDFNPTIFPEPEEEAPAFYARLFLRAIGVEIPEASPRKAGTASSKQSRSRTHR
jgi:AcrR family transcriptional regulator